MIRSQLLRLFLDCSKHGKTYEATLVSARLVNLLELQAKVSGELREHADKSGISVNILNGVPQTTVTASDEEVSRVQSVVIRALRNHPAARADVIKALDELAGESPAAPMVARNSASAAGNDHGGPPDVAHDRLLIEHEAADA